MLGMIQHDMVLFDHGCARRRNLGEGTATRADVNLEFQSTAKQADGAQKLAWTLYAANEAYATDYPAAVGPHMTNTDSTPFMDLVPAISVRENERGREIGAGWTRTGISRRTFTPLSLIRISGWASMPRRQPWVRSPC